MRDETQKGEGMRKKKHIGKRKIRDAMEGLRGERPRLLAVEVKEKGDSSLTTSMNLGDKRKP